MMRLILAKKLGSRDAQLLRISFYRKIDYIWRQLLNNPNSVLYQATTINNAQNILICKCKRNIGRTSVFSRYYRRLPINLNVMPLMTVGIVRICIEEMRYTDNLCM